MMRNIFFMILAEVGILSLPGTLKAQDEKHKVVILSPRVGATVDSSEREYFQLFRQIKEFHSAVILEKPDSTYYAWIVLKESNGHAKDTAVWYSKSFLLMLSEKIEHFEELTNGQYQMGQNPATLQAIESEVATRAPVVAKPRAEARAKAVEPESAPAGSRSEGAKVVLQLVSGRQFAGELLSVRDSALVISTVEGADVESLRTQSGSLLLIRNQEIRSVMVEGESNIGKGALTGFLAGAALGGLIGLTERDDPKNTFWSMTAKEKAVLDATVLGGIGLLVGTIAGIASSSSDKYVEPLPDGDLQILKPYARFPEKEPEFLREIQ